MTHQLAVAMCRCNDQSHVASTSTRHHRGRPSGRPLSCTSTRESLSCSAITCTPQHLNLLHSGSERPDKMLHRTATDMCQEPFPCRRSSAYDTTSSNECICNKAGTPAGAPSPPMRSGTRASTRIAAQERGRSPSVGAGASTVHGGISVLPSLDTPQQRAR